jgi:hypothetical protein
VRRSTTQSPSRIYDGKADAPDLSRLLRLGGERPGEEAGCNAEECPTVHGRDTLVPHPPRDYCLRAEPHSFTRQSRHPIFCGPATVGVDRRRGKMRAEGLEEASRRHRSPRASRLASVTPGAARLVPYWSSIPERRPNPHGRQRPHGRDHPQG